jgi:uncharacterized protein (DUF58 family)
MLSPEIIAKIKALDLRGRHAATDLMTGDYASAFHGRGMEFHEVREYVPGDDVRGIDWNVTARMNQPFIKVFREERELTLMLMVDVSASLASGHGRSRREAAAELAAILAWLAIKNNDRVGLVLFSDHVELFVPPRKGRGHVWRLIRDVLTWNGRGRGTNIPVALDHLARTVRRRAVCFLISDFLAASPKDALGRVARQHDLTCVRMGHDVFDGIIDAGVAVFADRETGELIEVDTSSHKSRQQLAEAHQEHLAKFDRDTRDVGADLFAVTAESAVVDQVAQYLRTHQAAGGRR